MAQTYPEKLLPGFIDSIVSDFRRSRNRMILLDYDGTLVPFTNEPRGASPSPGLLQALQTLTSDPSNKVVIISGRDKETLYEWLGHFDLDFACEHGGWIKEKDAPWISLLPDGSPWKKGVRDLFESFVALVPGAVIEEKNFSIVWHYRNAPDIEQNPSLIADVKAALAADLRRDDFEVFQNDMAIEAKASKINKGMAANRWIAKHRPDFIMAIGDDRTDEDIFRSIPGSAHTIKVRHGLSHARYSLPSHHEVLSLLHGLPGLESA